MFEFPGMVDLVGGNLAEQARGVLVLKAAGPDVAFREALLLKMKELQAELAGPNPSPLERSPGGADGRMLAVPGLLREHRG